MLVKGERPRVLQSTTEKIGTGCGNLYITIGHNEDNKPIEVFATLGKAGGCSQCQNEALTRAITLGLRSGIPVESYIKELKGLECPSKKMWPENERVLSCPDGIARALEAFIGNDKK